MATKKTLYGGETKKAVDNFPISGETVPESVIHWLGRIKGASARANAELGRLDPAVADAIATAADAVAAGEHDNQFPIDVFQTGSGTSSNMNANEVIAALAGAKVHPNDHVNMGQSSNDVFPSAVHLAALDEATNALLPALKKLERSLTRKAKKFEDVVKAGRTHLMDAVPVTLGQEFAGYAAQIRLGQERIEAALVHVRQIPLGGTATGTGLNTHPKFAEKVRKQLTKETKLKIDAPADPFEAQGNRDALVELSGALKVVAVSLTKIANDLALMGSGPRAGIGELYLPELQKGSSIMPGKVNPVIPEVVLQVAAQVIGNDTAVTIGGMQGQFELNVRVPLIARNVLAVDPPARDGLDRARREGRRRRRRQQGRDRPLGRRDARRRDRPQRAHRLRQGDDDRPEGVEVRAHAARRRARGGRRRRALRPRHRPAPDRGGLAGRRAGGRQAVARGARRARATAPRRAAAGLSAPRRRAAAPRRPPASRGRRR